MLDTILNIVAFAFIGVLLWLYFGVPMVDDDDANASSSRRDD
jgi:hypothetical protein